MGKSIGSKGLLIIFSLLLIQAGLCQGEGWPHWLGPNRNGSSPETGLLREWPGGGPKLLWSVKTNDGSAKWGHNGKGWGSVSVSKGQVFISGNQYAVWCLDAFTGDEIWKFSYELGKKKARIGWGWCPRDTVTVTEKYVYSINDQGQLYCLDRKNGSKIWFRDLDEEYKPSHRDWKGWCISPFIVDNVMVMSTKSSVVGLNAETGKGIWEEKSIKVGLSQTPQLVTINGQNCAIFVIGKPPRLKGLRMTDGKIVCDITITKTKMEGTITTPQIIDNKFILVTLLASSWWWNATQYSFGYLLEVDFKNPPFPSKLVWEKREINSKYSTWVYHDGYIYGFANDFDGVAKNKPHPPGRILTCAEIKTGKIMWQEKGFSQGESIITADGLLFVRSKEGLSLVEANPSKFILKGKVEQEQGNYFGWVMPTLAYGRLFVRFDGLLCCYQVAKDLPSRSGVVNSFKN